MKHKLCINTGSIVVFLRIFSALQILLNGYMWITLIKAKCYIRYTGLDYITLHTYTFHRSNICPKTDEYETSHKYT